MIQSLNLLFHTRKILILTVNLNFGNTVAIVTNPTILFPTVFENSEKTEKENAIVILDRNCL